MLYAERTSTEWIDRVNYQQHIFRNNSLVTMQKPFENDCTKMSYNTLHNITTKSQNKSAPLDKSECSISSDDFKPQLLVEDTSMNENTVHLDGFSVSNDRNEISDPRLIYNHAIDGFDLVGNRKGFLCKNAINLRNTLSGRSENRIVGVYCIRWRRAGDLCENETKLIVNCIEIVEAPLNLYCYLDEKMYVKVPMTLTISLKNTTNSTIQLKTCLKNADNFMFAGHSQVSFFSYKYIIDLS